MPFWNLTAMLMPSSGCNVRVAANVAVLPPFASIETAFSCEPSLPV